MGNNMDKKRLLELAGIQLNEGDSFGGEEKRSEDRTGVEPALNAFRNHMFKIKRALDDGDMKMAHGLVDGAIKAFGRK